MIFMQAADLTPHWYGGDGDSSTKGSAHDGVEDLVQQISELNSADKTKTHQTTTGDCEDNFFSVEERHALANLALKRNRLSHMKYESAECKDADADNPSTSTTTSSLLLVLVDLLFAYAMDHRLTAGDPTCESAWTISILSPTLSWLEDYTNNDDKQDDSSAMQTTTPMQVLCYGIRRSLIYPYIRNLEFVQNYVVADVLHIMTQHGQGEGGKRMILRCLLQIRSIMERTTSDTYHYLLNTIWIDDLCIWIQSVPDDVIGAFAATLKDSIDDAVQCGWDSPEIQQWIGLDLKKVEKEAYGSDGSGSSDESSSSDDSDSDSSDDDDDDDDDNENTIESRSARTSDSDINGAQTTALLDNNASYNGTNSNSLLRDEKVVPTGNGHGQVHTTEETLGSVDGLELGVANISINNSDTANLDVNDEEEEEMAPKSRKSLIQEL
jgi:hypothetical protein